MVGNRLRTGGADVTIREQREMTVDVAQRQMSFEGGHNLLSELGNPGGSMRGSLTAGHLQAGALIKIPQETAFPLAPNARTNAFHVRITQQ